MGGDRRFDARRRVGHRSFPAVEIDQGDDRDRCRRHLLGNHQAVHHLTHNDKNGNPDRSGQIEDPPDHLSLEGLLVEKALSGHHEIRLLKSIVQGQFVGDDVKAAEQLSADRRETTAEASACPGALQFRNVDAISLVEHLDETDQPSLEQLHLGWRCPFLGSEDTGGVDETSSHVTRDKQLDTTKATDGLEGTKGSETSVGRSRTTDPDKHAPGAAVESCGNQLSRAIGGRGNCVVFLRPSDQVQSRGSSHLDHRGSPGVAPAGDDGIAQRPTHRCGAICAPQSIEEPLTPIGEGHTVALQARVRGDPTNGIGNLVRRCRATKLVGGCHHAHRPIVTEVAPQCHHSSVMTHSAITQGVMTRRRDYGWLP